MIKNKKGLLGRQAKRKFKKYLKNTNLLSIAGYQAICKHE
jgi:hypothetical protein